MAGDPPPDYNRRNPRPSEKKPNENWREEYYDSLGAPPPRQKRLSEPNPENPVTPQTWRPNASNTKSQKREQVNDRAAPVGTPSRSPQPLRSNSDKATASGSPTSRKEQAYQPLPSPVADPNSSFSPRHSLPEVAKKKSRVSENPTVRRRKGGRVRSFMLYGSLTALVAGILIALFLVTRVASFLGGISVPRVDQSGTLLGGSGLGSGRVNILLLGLDLRPNDQADGARSDTMIVVSIDQSNKAASMLSIPRDLWLDIPGHGANRINTSYFFGEQDRPGGGPPLAKTTVSKLLGIPIDYFAQVDFNGFRQIVDAIGGVVIDVKKPLVDNEYPTEDFGIKRIYIPAGVQQMDGKTALEYARSRHSDSDLGRNQRQQAVLLAVREQGVNLGAITNTQLQSALQGAIKTDLQIGEILGLAQSATGMNKDNIRSYAIDANLTRQANIDGNDVLLPDQEGIRNLVRQFTSLPPALGKETANISVLNGTYTPGQASRTQKFLESKGYTINNVEQASDAGNYPSSVIRVYNGKQKTARELATLLGIVNDKIQVKSGGPSGIDIEVICGEDLKVPE